ncbi:hypothetical protein Scep_002705 [Stephania cephalantha]|uniref:Leucine-rich repeat-containing N-terminal plant-type domain-containing protein n=1 Tax=Stephania cephalantha TaxID=152367 RepID=A0AAP0Q654_9MAGN
MQVVSFRNPRAREISQIKCVDTLRSSSSTSTSTSNSTHKACLRDQSLALLQFKSSITIDEYIAHSNLWSWETNTSCCSWQGVTCNGYGFVIGLDASESGLSGMINSSTSLFKLRRLEKLNLAYNEFSPSSIPTAIIQLHSLTHLNLSSSGFSGQVPIEIYQLTSLVSLDFSFLYGLQSPNIESLSKNMSSLRELRLDGLNASISGWQQLFSSPKLHNLQAKCLHGYGTKLKTLNISHNLLDGFEQPVPDPSSSNLQILIDLRSNMFDGPIPDLPTTLGQLLLSDNNFTQVPVSICNLSLPVLLDLSNNRISGSIPPCLGKLATLNVLDLSKNKFSGSIRQEFDQFCNLNVLNLNANQLEGLLPRSLANCLRLQIECNRWRDDAPPTSSSSEKPQENPKSTIIDWKFAVAGYGGGIIVGVVVEHFILVRNMYYLGKILSIKRLIQGDKSIKFFVE